MSEPGFEHLARPDQTNFEIKSEMIKKMIVETRNLAEKNNNNSTENQWKKLDFLEKYVLTKMSVDEMKRRKEVEESKLPKVPEVKWKTFRNKQEEFDKQWDNFAKTINSGMAAGYLDELFQCWKENADDFTLTTPYEAKKEVKRYRFPSKGSFLTLRR